MHRRLLQGHCPRLYLQKAMSSKSTLPLPQNSNFQLRNEIPFNKFIQPIPLANKEPAQGSPGFTAGWGSIDPITRVSSDKLRGLSGITVIDFHLCKTIAPTLSVPKDTLCVITTSGSGLCEGDSGNPLIVDHALAGVVIGGSSCGDEYPGIVTNVAYYKSWIEDAMKGAAEQLLYSANRLVRYTGSSENRERRRHDELSSRHQLLDKLREATVPKE